MKIAAFGNPFIIFGLSAVLDSRVYGRAAKAYEDGDIFYIHAP